MVAVNGPPIRPLRARIEKGMRCWSSEEEKMLIVGLKEIIVTGWKSENGFRPGYLNALEQFMSKAFPGTDLKGNPHINSKIYGWKKNHGSLFSMLSKSGIGYNHTTKMIDASNEAWDAYVKVDGNAKFIRFKSWPYYEDWCEVFGKDRATGENAEGFVEAVNQVLNEQNQQPTVEEAYAFKGLDSFFDGIGEMVETVPEGQPANSAAGKGKSPMAARPESQPAGSASGKSKSTKKRKAMENNEAVCDLLGKFCESTNARLGEIAKRIGYEYDISFARKEVWAFVDTIEGMGLNEKLLASKLLVKDTEDLELFFSLPAHAKEVFAKIKLVGHL